MRTILLYTFCFFAFLNLEGQKAISPSDFLGYELGTRFTFHSKIESYCDYLANQYPENFKKNIYGKTEEGRNLFILIYGTQENLGAIDNIKLNHLRKIGLKAGDGEKEEILLTWYSFNVHGDEAATSETALKYLHHLAKGNPSDSELLIIDPCLNPDGRERYVQWFNSILLNNSSYSSYDLKLNQPWPSGRVNHYQSDLNRDWVWQIQKESQERLKLYHEWMPHIHIDFHEMEAEKSYFFPPPADPVHLAIEQNQLEKLELIGRNLATLFKAQSWEYFTKKEFDLFYPSYGDTYPIFNGAIALTLEQGGGGEAGLLYIKDNGDSLLLIDRVNRHFETAKVLHKTLLEDKESIIHNFQKFHLDTKKNGNGEFKTFIIKNENQSKILSLSSQLEKLNIEYHFVADSGEVKVFDFQRHEEVDLIIQANDLIISTYQPKGHLVRVLFEPSPQMKDSKTYDISSWALPFLHHLEYYGYTDQLQIEYSKLLPIIETNLLENSDAFRISWNSASAVRFLANALKNNASIFLDNAITEPSLIIKKKENEANYLEMLNLAKSLHLQVRGIEKRELRTLNKLELETLQKPKVALIEGEMISETEHGDILTYFDKFLGYPLVRISDRQLQGIQLDRFDVLILPDGKYGNVKFNEDKLKRWLANGGKFIVMQNALEFLDELEIGVLKNKNVDDIKYSKAKDEPVNLLQGAFFNAPINPFSPLRFGLPNGLNFVFEKLPSYQLAKSKTYFSSKVGLEDYISGYIGMNAKKHLEDSFVFGSYYFGSGVIHQIAINPLFRGILEDGKILMGNALFLPNR